MTKKSVVMIDDDNTFMMKCYHQALEQSGYSVIRLKTFKEAYDFIMRSPEEPVFWFIDVMISLGQLNDSFDRDKVAAETSYGLAAGLYLYRKLKARLPKARAILATSLTNPDVLTDIDKALKTWGSEDSCEAKLDIRPSDLVKLINKRTEDLRS